MSVEPRGPTTEELRARAKTSTALVSQRPLVTGSAIGWLDPGDYGRLPCHCHMMVLEIDPCGPRLIYVENELYPCKRKHLSTEWTSAPLDERRAEQQGSAT